jgi:RNA-directed DNA polymerase
LQHALCRAAKVDPGRRFHSLRDKVYRRDVLWRAWVNVRRNNGAAGIDKTTVAMVEESGVARLLDEVAEDLRDGSYRPLAARRVFIPKPGAAEQRPLSIPTVRDRVVQAAMKIVLEPIFEADMLPCSSEERVCDQAVLKLLRAMLRAGVMEGSQVRKPVTGTPQGGVISPLLANIYLHRLDRVWDVRRHGVLVRYADDLVVMCKSRLQAEDTLEWLRLLLADLGLEPKAAKTRIVHLQVGGEGFDFLGFRHRLVRSQGRVGTKGVTFLARWPSKKAVQHARDRVHVSPRVRWRHRSLEEWRRWQRSVSTRLS